MSQAICIIEVLSGSEGPCLTVGEKDSATSFRISGPKPCGSGNTIHKFKVDIDSLMTRLVDLKAKATGSKT